MAASHSNVARPWIIRKTDGRMYWCEDRETLQRWIGEGRVSRDDELSEKGDRWFKLGSSPDLEPLFTRRKNMTRGVRPAGLRPARPVRAPVVRSAAVDLDEDVDGLVSRFEKKQFAKRVLGVMAATAAVIVSLGYATAFMGPEKNFARTFAISNGILPGWDDAARAVGEAMGDAHEGFERGDIADLERAELIYSQAMRLETTGEIVANRLLVLGEYAASLDWLAREQEAQAKASDNETEQKRLFAAVADKRGKLESAMRRAAELKPKVEELAAGTIPGERALAEYYRVTGDPALQQQHVDRARALMTSQGKDDPWTLLVDAEAEVPDPERASFTRLAAATHKLEDALELRPKFHRARVQLARVVLGRGDIERAREELNVVLKDAPSYEEAQRLAGRLPAPPPPPEEAVAEGEAPPKKTAEPGA